MQILRLSFWVILWKI